MNIQIRDWTFTHWWVRPTVKVWFDIYHKSVTYSGTEHIDWEKPIIFAPTHQNAFSDALCLILPTNYTNNKFIYPLIRADAFGNSKALDWMLTVFHMLPVYRPRDKVNLKRRNDFVFENCTSVLAQNRNLLIHAEGNCIPQKRVRPLKKGLARIAFGAEEAHDFNLGVNIIPVGINYRNITEPRKGIHVRYGAPIPVGEYIDDYKQNEAKAIRDLTHSVENGVKEVAIDIQRSSNSRLSEALLLFNASINLAFSHQYSTEELLANQALAHAISRLDEKSKYELNQKVQSLKELLHNHQLDFDHPLTSLTSLSGLILEILIYIVLLPVIVYGWINNWLPWKGIHRVADKIDEVQFKSSARMVAGLLLFPLMYLLQTAIFFAFSESWKWSLLYLISIPFGGVLALNCWENFKNWKQKLRLYRLKDSEKQKIDKLKKEIFNELI